MISVSVVEAKYRRSNVAGEKTFLWNDADQEKRLFFLSKDFFSEKEDAILCYKESTDYSWVITNMRLIIMEYNKIDHYDLSLINKVGLGEVETNYQAKKNNNYLPVTIGDHIIKLQVEPAVWFVIYDILKFISNKKRKA
ncbi:hypothetical protein ACDQ55_21550 [Chitinophaga sp. 30R24]|uniref:hypothetical protein n=1 Tax=Chitinophaga sp. 30R24 TaxID=3248838 RepID=UPI003B91CEB9